MPRDERADAKLGFAVEAVVLLGDLLTQQAVGADDGAGAGVLDEEVVAHVVEGVGVEAGGEGLFESFVQFHIEHQEAQRLRGLHVLHAPGEPQ